MGEPYHRDVGQSMTAPTDGVRNAGGAGEIHAPTPQGGNTPVIPPPGSPGGNPNLVPK
jgi:hypothetical protein